MMLYDGLGVEGQDNKDTNSWLVETEGSDLWTQPTHTPYTPPPHPPPSPAHVSSICCNR